MLAIPALLVSVAAGRAGAAQESQPSMELLLYLAEWGSDERGRLIDPLDVPVEDDTLATTGQSRETAIGDDTQQGDAR